MIIPNKLTTKLLLWSTFVLSVTTTNGNAALSQEEINSRRNTLIDSVNHSEIGSGYAHMLSFFMEPDISASTYDVDNEGNTKFDIYKFPLQKNFSLNDDGLEIALRGVLSYATLEHSQNVIDNESVDSKWKAYSGSVGTGILVPVYGDLTFITAADLGLSHMENTSDYHGFLTDTFAQIVDGILYNWDTDAWIGSLVFGLDYKHLFLGKYTLDVKGRYTYSHISSFNEPTSFPSFSDSAQTFSLAANLSHPLGFSIKQYPFYGEAHLGNTTFIGENRDALGFDSFFELGYSLKVDVTHMGVFVKTLQIGYQLSIGENVEGHTFLFGWDLATF